MNDAGPGAEMRQAEFRAEKRAADIDLHDAIPIFGFRIRHGLADGDPSIVKEDVRRAECPHSLVDRIFYLPGITGIALQRSSVATGFRNAADLVFCVRKIAI